MPRQMNEKSLKNLKPQKKGDKALRNAGRKAGTPDRTTIVEKLLKLKLTSKTIKGLEESKKVALGLKGLTARELMWMAVLNRALTGDMDAIAMLEKVIQPEPEKPKRVLIGSDPEHPMPTAPEQMTREAFEDVIVAAADDIKARGPRREQADTSKT